MKHTIVQHFSSYYLSQTEINVLSYGLDDHIPTNINRKAFTTEFELFLQILLRNISLMPEFEINKVKTELRNTCEKYSNIKVLHIHREIISDLAKRDYIILPKQDKGRGVVVIDRSKYYEKCLEMLPTK